MNDEHGLQAFRPRDPAQADDGGLDRGRYLAAGWRVAHARSVTGVTYLVGGVVHHLIPHEGRRLAAPAAGQRRRRRTGVDTAYAAVSELSLLAGAPGFAADSQLAKARRDLNGLLYADGIHDSLYRAVGRALIIRPPAEAVLAGSGSAAPS